MAKLSDKALKLGTVLWDYQRLNLPLRPADLIIAMGCEDVRVAERAAELYREGYGRWLVCSGKRSHYTEALLNNVGYATEAEYFAAVVINGGVDESKVLLEDKATNSGENIGYIKELLENKHISVERIIVMTAPYSERRQQATYALQWPEKDITVTSPVLTFETYANSVLSTDYLINALVGRVQRMLLYADRGLQAEVELPEKVWDAYEKLVVLGFTQQLVKD